MSSGGTAAVRHPSTAQRFSTNPFSIPYLGSPCGKLWGRSHLEIIRDKDEQRRRIRSLGPGRMSILANLWVDVGQQGDQVTAHWFLDETVSWKKDQREGLVVYFRQLGKEQVYNLRSSPHPFGEQGREQG